MRDPAPTPRSRRVRIQTEDRGRVTFGKDLEPEERAWIRDELPRGLKIPGTP